MQTRTLDSLSFTRVTPCLTITFSGGEVCHELAHVALLQHGLGVYPFVNLGKKQSFVKEM